MLQRQTGHFSQKGGTVCNLTGLLWQLNTVSSSRPRCTQCFCSPAALSLSDFRQGPNKKHTHAINSKFFSRKRCVNTAAKLIVAVPLFIYSALFKQVPTVEKRQALKRLRLSTCVSAVPTERIFVKFGFCALLGYYAPLRGSSVRTFRNNVPVPYSRVKQSKKKVSCTSRPLKVEPVSCPATSV
jgi:hypothetical protein